MTARVFFTAAIVIASLCCGANVHTLNAQLAPGTRVRVQHAAGAVDLTTTGTVIAVTAESLSISVTEIGVPLVIRRDSIISLESARVGGNNMRSGAVVGFLSGGIVGGIISATSTNCSEGSDDCFPFLDVLSGATIGGLAGLAAGGLLGSRMKSDIWEPVQLPPRVSFSPGRAGWRISVAAKF